MFVCVCTSFSRYCFVHTCAYVFGYLFVCVCVPAYACHALVCVFMKLWAMILTKRRSYESVMSHMNESHRTRTRYVAHEPVTSYMDESYLIRTSHVAYD